MTDFDDLANLLRRAEARDRAAQADTVGELLGEMFAADENRRMREALGSQNDEVYLDRMRSERDRMRANNLETRRALGDTLSDEEERERADLASRRDDFGTYYAPADGGSE